MKKISFFLAVIIAVAVLGCNPKKEHANDATELSDIDIVTDNETDVIDEYDTTEEIVVLPKDTTSKTVVKPKNDGKEPVMVENEDGSVKKIPDEDIKKEEKSTNHVKKFYIVAGSFQNINNAVNLRQFFKKSGYPAMILYPYHGYNRVATGSYPDRASAEKDIKKFRAMNLTHEGNKIEYWLLWR